MKKLLNILTILTNCLFVISLSLSTSFAQNEQLLESKKISINVARVVNMWSLVNVGQSRNIDPSVALTKLNPLQASVIVEDLGGSTDVSADQKAYLVLYSKGEMFSTDAAFDLGRFFHVKGAKRIKAGFYEVYATTVLDDSPNLQDVVLKIDATTATYNIRRIDCEGEFDCDASTNFKATIKVSLQKN